MREYECGSEFHANKNAKSHIFLFPKTAVLRYYLAKIGIAVFVARPEKSEPGALRLGKNVRKYILTYFSLPKIGGFALSLRQD